MLILVVLVVGVVAALAAAGVAVASGEGRPERSFSGGAGLPLLLVVGAVAVVMLGAAAVGMVGLRGGGGGEDEPAAARPADTSSTVPQTAPAPPTPAVAEPVGNQPATPSDGFASRPTRRDRGCPGGGRSRSGDHLRSAGGGRRPLA